MGKFQDLSENDKIQAIKDQFAEIIGQCSSEPNKIKEYLKLGERPVAPAPLPNRSNMSDTELAKVEAKNKIAQDEFTKVAEEYSAREATVNKISEIISKLGKKDGCICGTCFNTDVANGVINPELEPLIEIARDVAETQEY